ncbi:hypothetical protein CDL15_Pgr006130 [Punica granatum]|uniref:Uncharacterized protein n=1 Tax=Punica granatum TaxID=22663 RepID=A0A218VUH8_PUNGR|nr:hypothetical protein CDL15_Pgr006130 [Punica granatum]PKI68018.1 hypothetical protein CRG98_011614 [Punica granatum]
MIIESEMHSFESQLRKAEEETVKSFRESPAFQEEFQGVKERMLSEYRGSEAFKNDLQSACQAQVTKFLTKLIKDLTEELEVDIMYLEGIPNRLKTLVLYGSSLCFSTPTQESSSSRHSE